MHAVYSLQIWSAAILILINSLFVRTTSGISSCFPGNIRVGLGCEICPAGTFSDTFNQLECTPCRAGTFRNTPGSASADQCRTCPEATFSASGATNCTSCPEGETSRPGSGTCFSCPQGTFFSFGRCRNCRAGTFSDKLSALACEQCPPGTSSRSGARTCTICPAGTFQDTFSCRNCPSGTISKRGASECSVCPPGSIPNEDLDGCIRCPKNTFSRFVVRASCAPCPAGTFTKRKGAAGCRKRGDLCPFDTFENKFGNCVACGPGQRMNWITKRCVSCGKRSFSLGGSTTSCTRCTGGSFPTTKGIFAGAECTCPDGYILDQMKCVPCPKGTFKQRGSCVPCPSQTFSDKLASVECKPCPEDSFTDPVRFFSGGGDACIACPPGTKFSRSFSRCFDPESGCLAGFTRNEQGKCVLTGSCPTQDFFKTLNPDGERICLACRTFERRANGECVSCELGEFSNGGGDTVCRKCPPRQIWNRFGPGCVCGPDFESVGGECLEPCQNFASGECGTCESGSVFSTTRINQYLPFKTTCESCLGNAIAVNYTTCVSCGPGLVPGQSIFRERVDICVFA